MTKVYDLNKERMGREQESASYEVRLGRQTHEELHDRGSKIHLYLMREGFHLSESQRAILAKVSSTLLGDGTVAHHRYFPRIRASLSDQISE